MYSCLLIHVVCFSVVEDIFFMGNIDYSALPHFCLKDRIPSQRPGSQNLVVSNSIIANTIFFGQ